MLDGITTLGGIGLLALLSLIFGGARFADDPPADPAPDPEPSDPPADPAPSDPAPSDPPPSGFFDQLSDEYKNSPSLKDLKSPDDVAKKLVNLESKVGADTIKRPKADAPQEEWDAFYREIGRPDTADEYKLPTEGLPENVEIPEADQKNLKQVAHELGLPPQQAAVLYRRYAETIGQAQQQAQQQRQKFVQEGMNQLRQELGIDPNEAASTAKQAVDMFDDEQGSLKAYLNETGLGDDPRMIKAFYNVRKKLAGDEIHGEGSGRGTWDAKDAQKKISELQNDPAWTNRNDPRHKEVMDEIGKLYEFVAKAEGDDEVDETVVL